MSYSQREAELESELSRLRAELAEAKPWMMFFRDNKTLGEIIDECGGTVYTYTQPFVKAVLHVCKDTNAELTALRSDVKGLVGLCEKLPTHQDCPVENHAIVVMAHEIKAKHFL